MTARADGSDPDDALVRHASAVALGADATSACFGVLIEGPTGSGKSSLALDLISLGAVLVADDRTRIVARDGWPWLAAPTRLAGVIEARGVGLLAVPHRAAAPLRLIVDLGETETDRLPPRRDRAVLGARIPLIRRVDAPHFAGAIVALSKGGWWHDG